MVDAPVSGGIAAAEGGTLTFMVGGTDEGFERARPYPREDGQGGDPRRRRRAPARPPRSATTCCSARPWPRPARRSCWRGSSASTSQTFFDISSKASGQSWSMTSYCPVPGVGPETPADRDYEGGFAAALMLKDLKLAMEAAQRSRRLHADGRRGRGALPALRRPAAAAPRISPRIIKMIDDSWKPPDGPSRSEYA